LRSIALSLALLGPSAGGFAQERAFDFALIGDMPYPLVQEKEYQRVLSALNANDRAFVVHVGDFQMDPRSYNPDPARRRWIPSTWSASWRTSPGPGRPLPRPAPTASSAPAQSSPALAFDDDLCALSSELETCGKPVAYLHGDTPTFRIDKPLCSRKTNRAFQNFTRVETFGWQDSHWVRITGDPADPQPFRFRAEVVPGNTVNGER
jgi:hypothetical protein